MGCFGHSPPASTTSYGHLLHWPYGGAGGPTNTILKTKMRQDLGLPLCQTLSRTSQNEARPGSSVTPNPEQNKPIAPSSLHPRHCLAPHPADAGSAGENGWKQTFPGSRAPRRAGGGREGRNSSISAGMSSRNSSQQISLDFTVLKGHLWQSLGCVTLRRVETTEECKPWCYISWEPYQECGPVTL